MTDLQHAKTLPFVGRRDAEPATQVYGEITSVEGGEYAVRTSGGIQVARRAVSCLVAPEIADRVLMAIGPGGEAFVLAVLERDHDQVNIAPDGDLRIELAAGSFAVVAKEGVELVSAKGLGLTADEMRLHARQGGVFFDPHQPRRRLHWPASVLRQLAQHPLDPQEGGIAAIARRQIFLTGGGVFQPDLASPGTGAAFATFNRLAQIFELQPSGQEFFFKVRAHGIRHVVEKSRMVLFRGAIALHRGPLCSYGERSLTNEQIVWGL